MKVGYIRVSSAGQNLARQLDQVEVEKVFQDVANATDRKRPGLYECLAFLRNGDELYVHSIDRLARNLEDLLNIVSELTKKNVAIFFHKEGLHFNGTAGGSSPVDELLLNLLGSVYAFEKAIINERRAEGMKKAKDAGIKFGRKKILTEAQGEQLFAMLQAGEKVTNIAQKFSIHRATVYRFLSAARSTPKQES